MNFMIIMDHFLLKRYQSGDFSINSSGSGSEQEEGRRDPVAGVGGVMDTSSIMDSDRRSFGDGRSFESREGGLASYSGLRDRLECKKVQPGNLHLLSSKYEVLMNMIRYLFLVTLFLVS